MNIDPMEKFIQKMVNRLKIQKRNRLSLGYSKQAGMLQLKIDPASLTDKNQYAPKDLDDERQKDRHTLKECYLGEKVN